MLHRNMNPQSVDLASRIPIVLIDKNTLMRQCFARVLTEYSESFLISSYASIAEWRETSSDIPNPVILFCAHPPDQGQFLPTDDIEQIETRLEEERIIIISNLEAPLNLATIIARGVRGYIPASLNVDVTVAAIRLVRAGGTFVPAHCLLAPQTQNKIGNTDSSGQIAARRPSFTDRQLAVIERLRQGESNKIIAYKLSMEECTVKVHVRNIMQKIKARNRTEIAYLTNHMFEAGKTSLR